MAKFIIGTPGGYEVEVTADTQEAAVAKARENWQSMPRIIAREGKTRVFQRANGQRYVVSPGFSSTDPAQVEQALSGMTGGEISRQSVDEAVIASAPAAARASQFVRGVPFVGSYADEAIGAVMGPEAAAGTRALQGAMQRERPGETLGLNLAGGLTGAAGIAAAAPRAIAQGASAVMGSGSRAAQMARGLLGGAGAGAVEGAVYGAGEGTQGSRARAAQQGALVGGTVGGALGVATPLVREGAQNVISLFRRSDIDQIAREFGISKDAARVVKNAFEMGDDMDTAMARLRQAGEQGMVGDAGEASQALLDATATSGPSGARAVKVPLEQRAVEGARQLDEGLTGLLGRPADGPKTAVQAIQRSTASARRDAYDAAFGTAINYADDTGRAIEDALDRVDSDVLMRAIREANNEMQSLGIQNQQILASLDDSGRVQFLREMPNVRQVNEIKKALDNAARAARDPRTGVETQQSLRYSRLARELRDALVQATGGDQGTYAQALRIGGDTIQEREAFQLGESLLSPRTRVEDVFMTLGDNPSAAQVTAAKAGLRTRIEEIVGNVRRIPSDPNIDARQMVATLREMGSDNAREKIRRVMGDEAGELIALLDEASIAAETRAATAANSRTAVRQATQQGVEAMTAPGLVGTAARGDPINASQRIVQAITGMTDEFTETQRQRIYQDVAKALTEKRGPEARAALGVINKAMQGQQLTEAQTAQLADMLAGIFFSAGTPTATRAMQE